MPVGEKHFNMGHIHEFIMADQNVLKDINSVVTAAYDCAGIRKKKQYIFDDINQTIEVN